MKKKIKLHLHFKPDPEAIRKAVQITAEALRDGKIRLGDAAEAVEPEKAIC